MSVNAEAEAYQHYDVLSHLPKRMQRDHKRPLREYQEHSSLGLNGFASDLDFNQCLKAYTAHLGYNKPSEWWQRYDAEWNQWLGFVAGWQESKHLDNLRVEWKHS